jgi:F-type H+-transporting ATPase subunit delta
MTDQDAVVQPESTAVADETVEIARRFAEALISAAEKDGAVDPVLDELDEIQRDVLKAFPRFAQLLASRRVSAPRKDKVLVDVFENRASSLVTRFLRVLNRHDRLDILQVVVREARAAWERRNRRIPIEVRSAVPLDENQLQALRDRLSKLTGANPILKVSIDPDLIAGLVVQVGDLRYDASAKSRLAQLRQRLIEGKTHEIQSRRDQLTYSA